MRVAAGFLSLFLSCAALAAATPVATVQAVQSPAWLQRDGRSQPLAVGMALKNGDRVVTGADARAEIHVAEGSAVKLGADAKLNIFTRSLKPQKDFKGALDVLTGAFRFTTNVFSRLHAKRDLAIRVGTATIGIRGTDVWGRSNKDEDLVCLIEGKIALAHGGETMEMADPMTFFVAPKGQAAQPVAPVDPEKLKGWARETDILPGDGAQRAGGRWLVRLGRVDSQEQALDIYDMARAAGFAPKIKPRPVQGAEKAPWAYEVVLANAATEADAKMLAARINGLLSWKAEVAAR